MFAVRSGKHQAAHSESCRSPRGAGAERTESLSGRSLSSGLSRAGRRSALSRTTTNGGAHVAHRLAALALTFFAAISLPARADAPAAVTVALVANPGRMAEAAIAVDSDDERRVAVAADPYLDPVRVQVTLSEDGGATWGPPLDVLPPTFAKSYDPSLAFDEHGRLLVVAGASLRGADHCQPGSVIFVAVVDSGTVTYQLITDTRGSEIYVDRPYSAYSPSLGLLVTWTQSSGRGAECRGVPLESQVMFTKGDPGDLFETPVVIPSSGFPAPFGASVATDKGRNVVLAIGEHQPGRLSRAVVVTSIDGGRSFGPAHVLAELPAVPTSLPQIGGFLAPVPSVAVRGGSMAVGWVRPDPAGTTPLVFLSSDGVTWEERPPITSPGEVETLTQVGIDGADRTWALTAAATAADLRLQLRHIARDGEWSAPTELARGVGSRFLEVGQSLGLAVTTTDVLAAFPLEEASRSTLSVTRHTSPRPPARVPQAKPSTTPPPDPTAERGSDDALPAWPAATAVGVVALTTGIAWHRRQRRRGTADGATAEESTQHVDDWPMSPGG